MLHPIPDMPGEEAHPSVIYPLKEELSKLCGVKHGTRFPGSQPISFTQDHLQLLEKMDFWVCEKSDGLRVMVFIRMNQHTNEQETWLVDRKQRFFRVFFPPWMTSGHQIGGTVIDGELIIDIDKITGEQTLRYYAFDCLVFNGTCITHKDITKRYATLMQFIVQPFEKGLKANPDWRNFLPFEMVAKKQDRAYGVSQVLEHIEKLQHGHDGLIFTCAQTPYVLGTDEKILKWKPASENSIDFKLRLRFPPSPHDPDTPNFTAKPAFLLYTWLGGSANSSSSYEFFDSMDMTDEEWEDIKQSGEQYDERIIEFNWDSDRETWKIMRFRDDKPDANHKSVMEKILVSIRDGVDIDAVLARAESIRSAWKAREAEAKQRAQAQAPPARHSDAPVYHAPASSSGALSGLKR